MRVLVTGAGGFIGRAVSEAFARQGAHVIALTTPGSAEPSGASEVRSCRLPDPQCLVLVQCARPDVIIHCAGTASVGGSFANPAQDFTDNVVATEQVLRAIATRSPASRLVLLSSAAVFGEPEQRPTQESAKRAPISPYGFHKLMCETLCEEYFRLWGVQSVIARLFSVYGPGLRKQLLWDVYQKCLKHDEVQLGGDGWETRDFMFVDDAVRALLLIVQRSAFRAESVHVGTGQSVTVASVAGLMVEALGQRKPVRFNAVPRQGDPLHMQADNRRLVELGMTDWTTLASGVRAYADWVRTQ